MRKFKRFVARVLTAITLISLCDWSVFISHAEHSGPIDLKDTTWEEFRTDGDYILSNSSRNVHFNIHIGSWGVLTKARDKMSPGGSTLITGNEQFKEIVEEGIKDVGIWSSNGDDLTRQFKTVGYVLGYNDEAGIDAGGSYIKGSSTDVLIIADSTTFVNPASSDIDQIRDDLLNNRLVAISTSTPNFDSTGYNESTHINVFYCPMNVGTNLYKGKFIYMIAGVSTAGFGGDTKVGFVLATSDSLVLPEEQLNAGKINDILSLIIESDSSSDFANVPTAVNETCVLFKKMEGDACELNIGIKAYKNCYSTGGVSGPVNGLDHGIVLSSDKNIYMPEYSIESSEAQVNLLTSYMPNSDDTIDNFWGQIISSTSGVTSSVCEAICQQYYNDLSEGESSDESATHFMGIYREIFDVIQAQAKEAIENMVDAIDKQNEANNLINANGELMVSSLEDLISIYTYRRLLYERNDSDWDKDAVEIGNKIAFKTSLKNKNSGKKYVLITDSTCSSGVSSANLVANDALNKEFDFLNAYSLRNEVSDLFLNQLESAYYYERKRTAITRDCSMIFKYRNTWNGGSSNVTLTIDGIPYSGTSISAPVADKLKDINEENCKASTILEYISFTFENGLYITYNGLMPDTKTDESAWNVYNSALNNLKPCINIEGLKDVSYIESTLPTEIGALGTDGHTWFNNADFSSADTDWYRFVEFLHATAMGFDIAAGLDSVTINLDGQTGGEGSTYGFSPEYIKELSKNWTSEDPESEQFENGGQIAIEMVRAIIGLKDFMDAMGIPKDAWTENIKEYYDLADDLEIYRTNKLISKVVVTASLPTPDEPLGNFFSVKGQDMSDYWRLGFAISSTYVPFESNLYDASAVTYTDDTKWISDFYYKYGFHRKALMINTDKNAITNEILTGKKSGTRVATLKDLVQPSGDVILTVDDDFYNADQVNESISKIDYTSIRGTTSQGTGEIKEDEENLIEQSVDKITNAVENVFELNPEVILKTDGSAYYSQTLAQNCTKMEEESSALDIKSSVYDSYLLSKEDIMNVMKEDEYSVKQSYAVVSSIYRSTDLYNLTLNSLVGDNEIFRASSGVAGIASENTDDYKTYLNYMMLKGLERQMKNTSGNQLDMNAPIFCDIFGNIITESGDVIIPASANTTLAGDEWTAVNVGFATLVGEQYFELDSATEDFKEWLTGMYEVPVENSNRINMEYSTKYDLRSHKDGCGWFSKTDDGYTMMPCMVTEGINSMVVNWKALPVNSVNFKNVVYTKAYNDVSINKFSGRTVNMVLETLRGAPIENINYEKEELAGNIDISKFGIYSAFKLESLINDIYSKDKTSTNSMLTYPNLVFISGLEYVILYIYKLAFAIMVLSLFIHIYLDATRNNIGIRSALNFSVTIALVIFCVTLIPQLINWSYYKANKDLLSDEMGYLVMLNYAKDLDGAEINVSSLDKPSTTTETYLKLEDIKFDWFNATTDVIFQNTFETVSDIYDDALKDSSLAKAENVVREGNSLYYPIEQLLRDADIIYNTNTDLLSLRAYDEHGAASYISPYFIILRQLVTNINWFNSENGISAMTVQTTGGEDAGQVVTYDLVTEYLTSDVFIAEGYDITGLHKVLQDDSNKIQYAVTPFSTFDIEKCKQSYWYPDAMITETKRDAVNDLEEYARKWVAENEQILGKVPDEVLIKCLALQLAIKFNQIIGCPYGNAVEIINLDSRDLFRLMISTENNTYKYFSFGLARYTYEMGGAIACLFMMMFCLMDKLLGALKVVMMITIIGLLLFNVIFRKLMFGRDSKCFEGYLITCAGICLVNYLYAGALYIQMKLANWGLNCAFCIGVGLLIQFAYIGALILIVIITVKDWKNIGYNTYEEAGSTFISSFHSVKEGMFERRAAKHNEAYAASGAKYQAPNRDGEDILNEMFKRDSVRTSSAANPDEIPKPRNNQDMNGFNHYDKM